jgi:hypothetical protein
VLQHMDSESRCFMMASIELGLLMIRLFSSILILQSVCLVRNSGDVRESREREGRHKMFSWSFGA